MKGSNRRAWEGHVEIWNQEYYPLSDKKNNILQWLRKLPRGKILDEGCGIGQWAITLAKLRFKAVGLDFSEKLLAIARKNSRKYKVSKKCRFVKGDIRKLPFKNGVFDAVLSAGIIEHVPETEICLGEISRVLRKKGYLIVHVPHKIGIFTVNRLLQQFFGIWKAGYEKSFAKPYFRKLLQKHGFKILRESTNKIEGRTFITKFIAILDVPLYAIGLGGHHISMLCQKAA